MKPTNFERMFAHRSVLCFFLTIFLFLTCVLRVAVTATGSYAQVQEKQSSYRLTITKPRGTIFDHNMVPLTNRTQKIIAVVAPTPRAIVAISTALQGNSTLPGVLSRLSSGKPVLCEVPQAIDCDGIVCTTIYTHNAADQPAAHMIGYTDSDGHGVSGIEAAYDKLLYSDQTVSAVYKTDGVGNVLEGVDAVIENESPAASNAVVTTLDINIQNITEQAAQGIEKGTVVICDAKGGEIRAMVSRPGYDCTAVSRYLTQEDSPLLNRALAAYSVGSVFKPCVAAAGLENGNSAFSFTCTGSSEIMGRIFKCHNHNGHGLVTLREALAVSCNTFFYNFALAIGAKPVYNMASSLGFGQSLEIADSISTSQGELTALDELSNDAQLANLSIGQGKLLLSPVSMLTLYSAIASDGAYYIPSLVSATISGGKTTLRPKSSPTRVMTSDTAAVLREYLAGVITDGTGIPAKPQTCTAGGKTATAQTGRYDETGTEITHGWFCGFFPAEQPRYVVVIMVENSAGSDTASIFAKIADGIMQQYPNSVE